MNGECISFGPFRLFPTARVLEKDGQPLALGNRALDLLTVLVEHAGEVVAQRELLSRVWRGLIVCPANLRVHMNALRKALGDSAKQARYVANVTGQGYCFVAPVQRRDDPAQAIVAPVSAASRMTELPPVLKRILGRDNAVSAVAAELIGRRFVTVVGPGGIGKTTVAIAAAHSLRAQFDGAVCFVDLGRVTDSRSVLPAVASALGLELPCEDELRQHAILMGRLRVSRMLLVLDNCEHVINTAAVLAERIFNETSGVHILATSRETLRVEGEGAYRLPPLSSPPLTPDLKAETALSFPAVQLFMERAAASGHRLPLTDAEAHYAADICSRLDGIALAIEHAASQVGTHGIVGTWSLLQRRLLLDWPGRRTAPPRHRTLRSLLDWSYRLLTDAEQSALRRLSMLVGSFTVDAAAEFAAGQMLDVLVEKSLLSVLMDDDGSVRYRVPETTRTYLSSLPPAITGTRHRRTLDLPRQSTDSARRSDPQRHSCQGVIA